MLLFIGVGVGPGDPELLTVKALRACERADVILVPSTEVRGEGPGRAEEVLCAANPEFATKMRRLPFSMSRRVEERQSTRDAAADAALAEFGAGATVVVFASIGDVSVYSTFSYTAARVVESLSEVSVEVVPGITAMQTLAAVTGEPLCLGDEVLALVPATAGEETVARTLAVADSVVIYKGGRHAADVVAACRNAGKDALIATELGRREQTVAPATDDVERLGYFTTIWARPKGDRA